jgi:hypothetical protein
MFKKRLDSIIQERSLQRFAYRLFDALREIITTVDFQSFGNFGKIMMAESKEWDQVFSDLSPRDQADIKDVAKQLHQARLVLRNELMNRP